MEHERPRWRFRISTLMLLVIIMALASALVSERLKREWELQRLDAQKEAVVARMQAEAALANAQQARARSGANARSQPFSGESSVGTTGETGP
jgi:hypothetical protein